jgi:prepilin-type N-terminal cleavage/methylation domain-containing protein
MSNFKGKRIYKLLSDNSCGVTLVELVMAMAVVSIIMVATYSAMAQLFNTNTRSTSHMVAVRQVQSAGYWVSRDGLMALQINDTAYFALTNPTNKLELIWTDWRNTNPPTPDVVHDVMYRCVNGQLSRSDASEGGVDIIADHISSVEARFEDNDSDGNLDTIVFDITATVGSELEHRTYEVVPRTHIK